MSKNDKKVKNTAPKQKTGGLGIREQMLLKLLPTVLVATILLTVVSAINSKKTINTQIQETMNAELASNSAQINAKLDTVRYQAVNLAREVSMHYSQTSMDLFKASFSEAILSSDIINGAGIWFEPNVYNPEEKYMGPYWYKDGGSIVETYEYSNAEYDYFAQEYYTNAKAMEPGSATITDPYYDPSSGTVMASCSAPIYAGKTFIGCVTCDIQLDTMVEIASAIKVGTNGTAMLLSSSGAYIYTDNEQKVSDGVNITEDENASLAKAGAKVLAAESGLTTYTQGSETYNLYYSTIPGVNWKLMIRMPQSEINAPVKRLTTILVAVAVIAILFIAIVIALIANSLSKTMNKVKAFAMDLAKGDFTVEKIDAKGKDELGMMSGSLNEMYESNRDVISRITTGSSNVNDSSLKMNQVATELSMKFGHIHDNMGKVNDAMMSAGAATEEVSASVNEVNESVQFLADETSKTSEEVEVILKRASEVEESSRQAYDHAIAIVEKYGDELKEANKRAEIVSEIGDMANSIADIADQINLLSLNASIEAARAGEHGRGFAVVASEINKLATDTGDAVERIKVTIEGVQSAFKSMSGGANQLLDFVQETVAPDYDNFVNIGVQYGQDATAFKNLADSIGQMVSTITESMEQVNAAVANIAESAQDTAANSADITETVDEVSIMVDDVEGMATEQKDIASDLSNIVSQFKL
ncbi:MAG: methyl-accepting chemotaxis protein [Lachnospiraceae bacterium]|nr:methyl-accepting chemotaxis protein [Lachnospiraceae bacterium]